MMRARILAPMVLVLLAMGCPKPTDGGALPPAGLAGAPGSGTPTEIPTRPMPGPGEEAAQALAGAPANAAAGMPSAFAPPPTGAASSMPAGHPSVGTVIPGNGAPSSGSPVELAGSVLEAQHVKEYTYVLVKDGSGNETWAAVLKDESIKVGSKLELGKEIWMQNFESKGLNRTFDRILFGRILSKT